MSVRGGNILLLRFFLLWCAVVLPRAALAEEPTFAVRWSDGTFQTGLRLLNWNEPAATPTVNEQKLFDNHRRATTLLREPAIAAPTASGYVEFRGGDRLAGTVREWRSGQEDLWHLAPQHLMVEAEAPFTHPVFRSNSPVRVILKDVRRIVRLSVTNDYQPGTAWQSNGGMISFTSLRWAGDRVSLLTSDGLKDMLLADLAELHLPATSDVESYYEMASILTPEGRGTLVRAWTDTGDILTTSLERLRAHHYGDRGRRTDWIHNIQPAWVLDPLWVRIGPVHRWTIWDVKEPPLSWFSVAKVERSVVFGDSWKTTRNDSLAAGPLNAGGQLAGEGYSVFGSTRLEFRVPLETTAIAASVGMDSAARGGGFVRTWLESVNHAGQRTPLGNREEFRGQDGLRSWNWINLPAIEADKSSPGDTRTVALVSDMAADGPADREPLDVRDFVTWLEPRIRLDESRFRERIASMLGRSLPSLAAWASLDTDATSLRLRNAEFFRDSPWEIQRPVLRTPLRFVTFRRRIKIGDNQSWLGAHINRLQDGDKSTWLELRVEGESLGEVELPKRDGPIDPQPVTVNVARWRGKVVTVEATIRPRSSESEWEIEGLWTGSERPGRLRIFDDESNFAERLQEGEGLAFLANEGAFKTAKRLDVTAPGKEQPDLFPAVTIRELPKLGEYRFLLFAWRKEKQPQGEKGYVSLGLAHQGRFREAITRGSGDQAIPLDERGLRHRYTWDTGDLQQSSGGPLRVEWRLPREWQLNGRDIFGDFGNMDLTGLSFGTTPGDPASFDCLYLLRTPQDMDELRRSLQNPEKPDPIPEGAVAFTRRRPEYQSLIRWVAPQFVAAAADWNGLTLLKEFNGEKNVVKVHCESKEQPFILALDRDIAANQKPKLTLKVHAHPETTVPLDLYVNGERIETLTLSGKDGWQTPTFDLTRFAGQKIRVELRQGFKDWNNDFLYWKKVSFDL